MGLGKSPTTHELRPWLQVVRRVQSERGVIVQSLLCEGNYAPRVFTGLAGEIRSCLLSKRHCPKFLTTQCRQVVLSSSRTLHFSKCHSFQTSPPTHDKIPSGLAEVFTLPVLVFSFLLSFCPSHPFHLSPSILDMLNLLHLLDLAVLRKSSEFRIKKRKAKRFKRFDIAKSLDAFSFRPRLGRCRLAWKKHQRQTSPRNHEIFCLFFFAFSKFSESHKRKSAAATCGCYVAPFMDESLQNLRQIADIIHTCRVFTRSCLRLRSGQKKRIH